MICSSARSMVHAPRPAKMPKNGKKVKNVEKNERLIPTKVEKR